jgi:hypothetical protein
VGGAFALQAARGAASEADQEALTRAHSQVIYVVVYSHWMQVAWDVVYNYISVPSFSGEPPIHDCVVISLTYARSKANSPV